MSRSGIRAALRPIAQHAQKQAPAIRLAARARGYASEAGGKNSQSLLLGGLAVAGAGAAYYAYSGNSGDGHLQAGYSSKPKNAASASEVDYQKVSIEHCYGLAVLIYSRSTTLFLKCWMRVMKNTVSTYASYPEEFIGVDITQKTMDPSVLS